MDNPESEGDNRSDDERPNPDVGVSNGNDNKSDKAGSGAENEDGEKRSSRRKKHSSRDRKRKKSHKSSKKRRHRSSSRKRKKRSRSRSRDRRRGGGGGRGHRRRRSHSRSRSFSPRPPPEEDPNKPRKFWDGFQWVIQQPAAVGNNPAILSQTRKDRRLYVGNLPPAIEMDQLRDFINAAMEACGGVPAGVNQAVLSVWIGPEGKYSFVEFTTVECATVALGLNGINCMGFPLKISRSNHGGTTGQPPQTNMAVM